MYKLIVLVLLMVICWLDMGHGKPAGRNLGFSIGTQASEPFGQARLIEAESTLDGRKIAQTDDGVQFEVPSYASGIVIQEPFNDLLPPFSTTNNADAAVAAVIGDSSIPIGEAVNDGLIDSPITVVQQISTPSVQLAQDDKRQMGKTLVFFEQAIEVPYTDLLPPVYNTEAQREQLQNSVPAVVNADAKSFVNVKSAYDGDIYKGGFGGPAGILGDQKSIGTYHINKEKNKTIDKILLTEVKYDDDQTQTRVEVDILLPANDLLPPPVSNLQETVTSEINKNLNEDEFSKKLVGDAITKYANGDKVETIGLNENQKDKFASNEPKRIIDDYTTPSYPEISTKLPVLPGGVPTQQTPLYVDNIYKGGFGGPSGFLGDQKTIGTAHQHKKDYETAKKPSEGQDTTTEKIVTPTTKQSVPIILPPTKNPINQADIYRGGFGGPVGILGEQKKIGTFHQMKLDKKIKEETTSARSIETLKKFDSPVKASSTSSSSLYEGDIYKGGFGGPKGFLGEQKTIGTFHQSKNKQQQSKAGFETVTFNDFTTSYTPERPTVPSSTFTTTTTEKQFNYFGVRNPFSTSPPNEKEVHINKSEEAVVNNFPEVETADSTTELPLTGIAITSDAVLSTGSKSTSQVYQDNQSNLSQIFQPSSPVVVPALISGVGQFDTGVNTEKNPDPSIIALQILSPSVSTPAPPSIYFTPPFLSSGEQLIPLDQSKQVPSDSLLEKPVQEQLINTEQDQSNVNVSPLINTRGFLPPPPPAIEGTFIQQLPLSNAAIYNPGATQKPGAFDTNVFDNSPGTINQLSLDNSKQQYQGSFGGATGFLGNQKQPGFAVTSGTKPIVLPNQQGNNNNVNNPFAGVFQGGSSVSSAEKQPVLTSPASTSFGAFGGAPGILGEQKQPGYGVQQQNTIKPPSNTNFDNTQKYNGGFGGPPGVLRPFDNKSQ